MRAELRWLETNDFRSWDEFAAAERPDPFDCSGWFSYGIGLEGEAGTENFQFVAVTPARLVMRHRFMSARTKRERFAFIRVHWRFRIFAAGNVTIRTRLSADVGPTVCYTIDASFIRLRWAPALAASTRPLRHGSSLGILADTSLNQ